MWEQCGEEFVKHFTYFYTRVHLDTGVKIAAVTVRLWSLGYKSFVI